MSPDLAIHDWLLPYEKRLDERPQAAVDLAVIHCTELPDLKIARDFGERIQYNATQTGNSGHYYIDRDGQIYRFVTDTRVAHHTSDYNARAIGIELVNQGRYPHWNDSRHQNFTEKYMPAQIDALIVLLRDLRQNLSKLRYIAGHEDLDRRLEPASDDPRIMLPRRQDPGPLFPWMQVLSQCGLERMATPHP